ncbi:MAG: 30S ribosomal protein S12 methylthiotransferase RimO [Thermodesulfovibrionales bacterium]
MRVSLLSLGCPKNSVDSENLLAGLLARGATWTEDPEEADIMLVNTCGFIEDAKRESIEEILRLSTLKDGGRKLLVFGCLAERYREELRMTLPEVDAIYGVGQEEEIINYCAGTAPSREGAAPPPAPEGPAAAFSYVKVAEGCDRLCTFCVIPSIRGRFRSLDPDQVLRTAEEKVRAGARELVLVGQDVGGFGRDRKGYGGLPRLLREMASISGDFWIRLLYLYPTSVDDRLLEAIAGEDKVCKYVDMPLQHSERGVLRDMGRGGSRRAHLSLIGRIRDAVPGVAIRTAVIVGFPGEGEREFRGLMDFVEEARFEKLGVFKYSREEGTPAAGMRGQVAEKVKARRMEELMELQAGISLGHNRALVGRRMKVLVEEALPGGGAQGRIYSQAPEIDGVTHIEGRGIEACGFSEVVITAAEHYDLRAALP